MIADPEQGFIVLGVSTMLEVEKCLEWTMEHLGVASPGADFHIQTTTLPEKLEESIRIANLCPNTH
jgi:hypothetical protein